MPLISFPINDTPFSLICIPHPTLNRLKIIPFTPIQTHTHIWGVSVFLGETGPPLIKEHWIKVLNTLPTHLQHVKYGENLSFKEHCVVVLAKQNVNYRILGQFWNGVGWKSHILVWNKVRVSKSALQPHPHFRGVPLPGPFVTTERGR